MIWKPVDKSARWKKTSKQTNKQTEHYKTKQRCWCLKITTSSKLEWWKCLIPSKFEWGFCLHTCLHMSYSLFQVCQTAALLLGQARVHRSRAVTKNIGERLKPIVLWLNTLLNKANLWNSNLWLLQYDFWLVRWLVAFTTRDLITNNFGPVIHECAS